MYKYVILLFLLLPLAGFSQVKLNFQEVDSLSYQYYQKGRWDKLIVLTNEAFKQEIDSKFIRQRAGYAYFMSGDYTAAGIQYQKALEFDLADESTREYLYYSSLLSGAENCRLFAGNLPAETASRLGIRRINPVGMIDSEFNLKTNQIQSRSNQIYYRIGINSELGYRFSLYQAFSYYEQIISNVLAQQPEYMALLKWSLSPAWQIKGAYHHLFTINGNISYPGNLGIIALSTQMNRFSFEANASVLNSSLATTQQFGLQTTVVLPGRSNIYLTGSLVGMIENSAYRTIYSQTAGFKCSKNIWVEGNVTLGNLKNYNTYYSLYVYNSVDPSLFRSGLSLIYFLGKHLTISGNFAFDQMHINKSTALTNYYQYSYSGGLKWRL
jgi:tetratricopeptide (TPR) repeat protein